MLTAQMTGPADESPSLNRPVHLALLADLGEPVGPDATTETGVVTFETVRAIQSWSENTGGVSVDLFARRGSWGGLPLVSVDPDELGPTADDSLAWFAVQEAVYGQLWIGGMLHGYDLVHCLAPVVSPIQFLVGTGTPVVQSLVVPPGHPSCWLPPRLLPGRRVRRVALTRETGAALGLPVVEMCVDLSRFALVDVPAHQLAWDGTGGRDGAAVAAAVGDRLGYPVRSVTDGDAPAVLQGAVALLHLAKTVSPCGAPWALRALACGTPVAGWEGVLDGLVAEPASGAVAPVGDWAMLADRIRCVPDRSYAGRRRRERLLARHGPTAMVARYRAIYRELLETAV